MTKVARAVLAAPFTVRARRELLWCALWFAHGVAGVLVLTLPLQPGTAVAVARGIPIIVVLLAAATATGASQSIAKWYRGAARLLLSLDVDGPAPDRVERGSSSWVGGLRGRMGDAAGWRATAYVVVKVPLSLLAVYALLYWVGFVNLTYPFWWGLFRNHAPGVRLSPVGAVTPFGWQRVATLPGTAAVFAAGAAMVLVAPWVTRAVTAVDRWLIGYLLGTGVLGRRVRELQAARAQLAEDAATTLRRIERDLHDGTQAQLATLAMKLGQAKEKLDPASTMPFDPAGAFELVDEAHRHAKEALIELRDIARGIHPPALDVGLDAALTTLVARSPVPATLRVDGDLPASQAIGTIAYFSVAELLANAAKHSRARQASVSVGACGGALRLSVRDDGVGGARPGLGSGLRGLADRVGAIDGSLDISSPDGGPTVVTIVLPVHA